MHILNKIKMSYLSISVGRKVSANLSQELLAMFSYPLFFIVTFC